MKYIFTVTIILFAFAVKAQSIKITAVENVSDKRTPVINTKFEITLNDTIKLELTTGSDGLLGKIPLDKGSYNIRLDNKEFLPAEVKDIVVGEGKTAYVDIMCRRITTLSKEEKKKLGIK